MSSPHAAAAAAIVGSALFVGCGGLDSIVGGGGGSSFLPANGYFSKINRTFPKI